MNIFEIVYEDATKNGIEQGVEKNKIEVAVKLIARGDSIEDVADISGLSIDKVRELTESNAS